MRCMSMPCSWRAPCSRVRLLLARGADPNERIYENEDLVTDPVYSAIAEGNIEVAKLMLEHTDFDSLQKQNAPFAADEQDNLLCMALGAGSKYHVEMALERGMGLRMELTISILT